MKDFWRIKGLILYRSADRYFMIFALYWYLIPFYIAYAFKLFVSLLQNNIMDITVQVPSYWNLFVFPFMTTLRVDTNPWPANLHSVNHTWKYHLLWPYSPLWLIPVAEESPKCSCTNLERFIDLSFPFPFLHLPWEVEQVPSQHKTSILHCSILCPLLHQVVLSLLSS